MVQITGQLFPGDSEDTVSPGRQWSAPVPGEGGAVTANAGPTLSASPGWTLHAHSYPASWVLLSLGCERGNE